MKGVQFIQALGYLCQAQELKYLIVLWVVIIYSVKGGETPAALPQLSGQHRTVVTPTYVIENLRLVFERAARPSRLENPFTGPPAVYHPPLIAVSCKVQAIITCKEC